MGKQTFLFALIAIVAGFLIVFAYELGRIQNPYKITDPTDPRFDPASFRLADYPQFGDRLRAVEHVIPPGMTKVDAETFLESCCPPDQIRPFPMLPMTDPKYANAYQYTYRPWFALIAELISWDQYQYLFTIVYDENDQVKIVSINGP